MRAATVWVAGLVSVLVASGVWGAGEPDYAEPIRGFLRESFAGKEAGMVVAVVDEGGTRVFGAGGMGDGTGREVGADTVFEIGSVTKTFTALLLLDMERRGEVRGDDLVGKYLPESVKVPARDGRGITLENLAAQDSGLPFNADNLAATKGLGENPFADFTAEKMYDFLSRYQLKEDPGTRFQYSNIGMGLLGHVLARRAGEDYESLVVGRICRPLGMGSTRVGLSPELRGRLAVGHDESGRVAPNWDVHAIVGAGGLRSTAEDLAKYVAAHLGLGAATPLGELMGKAHAMRHEGTSLEWGKSAMPWYDQAVYNPPGSRLLGHGGGTGGYSTFVGLDLGRRRGVVVVSNQTTIHSTVVGWRILQGTRLSGVEAAKMMPVREIVGVGAALGMEGGRVRITAVVPDSPAARAGVPAGVAVESIDGRGTAGRSLAECMGMLRGEAGTVVRVAVAGAGAGVGGTREIAVTRGRFMVGQ